MVKGINRTVIEINDTGNNMFERVILFVTPEYGNISTRQLKKEAQRVIEKYSPDIVEGKRIRNMYRKKRIVKTVLFVAGALLLLGFLALIIF